MLRPATVVHLPILRTLIRDGAAAGSFDRGLAIESREAAQFFAHLRQALATGYFVEEDPRTGGLSTVAVPGYVYLPDTGAAANRPIGFGLFKAVADGYELWLTGVEGGWRGHGHGRALLDALLKTPPGRKAFVVRINAGGHESPAMAHLLQSFGYSSVRETPQHAWYLRHDAPEELGQSLRGTRMPKTAS